MSTNSLKNSVAETLPRPLPHHWVSRGALEFHTSNSCEGGTSARYPVGGGNKPSGSRFCLKPDVKDENGRTPTCHSSFGHREKISQGPLHPHLRLYQKQSLALSPAAGLTRSHSSAWTSTPEFPADVVSGQSWQGRIQTT